MTTLDENMRLRDATSKLVTRLFDEKLRADRAEAALCLIKGLCEVRNRSNDEIMGYRDPLIEKILSAIVKATS